MNRLRSHARTARSLRPSLLVLERRDVPALALAVTPAAALIRFDTNTPGMIQSSVPLTGLQAGDVIAGIDFRIGNGQLFALGIRNTPGPDEGRIYRINQATGACTLIGGPFSTTLADGAAYGFDADPVHDNLRVVNSARQNFAVSLVDGSLVTTGADLHFGDSTPPSVVAIAYTGGLNPGTHPTQELVGIDTTTNSLVHFGGITSDEDTGNLSFVDSLGVTPVNNNIAVDYRRSVGQTPAEGFATVPTAAGTGLYRLDHLGSTGEPALSFVGLVAGATSAGLNGFALAPIGVASLRVVAAGPGGLPTVRAFDSLTGALKYEFSAYDSAFHGGVRVALGDFNGDGVPDIITAPGPGGGPHIRIFDGRDGTNIPGGNFLAYEPSFTGGVFVACVARNPSTIDIVTTPDVGGGPLLKRFSILGELKQAAIVFDPESRRGARVAMGDVNGDGFGDYIVAEGPGVAPAVRVLSGAPATPFSDLGGAFQPYDPRFLGGVYVAAGDVTGDGMAEIITGAGEGGGPHVRVFGQAPLRPIAEFLAYDPQFTGGVRVGIGDANGDGRLDILTGPGPTGGPDVRGFDGTTGALLSEFLGSDSAFHGGIYIAGNPRP